MALPSATDPRFIKTTVTRVDCYYLGRKDGTVELCNLHTFDFREAATAHPDQWVLAEPVESLPQFKPYEMPVGPDAPKVIDKREKFSFPMPQPPPPQAMVEMTPMHLKRGPGGGPLIPSIGRTDSVSPAERAKRMTI